MEYRKSYRGLASWLAGYTASVFSPLLLPEGTDVYGTFLRLIRARPTLADARHERAWLIRTVSNVCRDQLRSKARQHEDLDDHVELAAPEQGDSALLAAVLALPEKYRIVLYLYGVEGYSVREIAALLRRPPNTVKTRLSRAREMLRTEWEA